MACPLHVAPNGAAGTKARTSRRDGNAAATGHRSAQKPPTRLPSATDEWFPCCPGSGTRQQGCPCPWLTPASTRMAERSPGQAGGSSPGRGLPIKPTSAAARRDCPWALLENEALQITTALLPSRGWQAEAEGPAPHLLCLRT